MVEFGYQSVWVDRFGKTFDKLDYQPKFKIKDLSELKLFSVMKNIFINEVR